MAEPSLPEIRRALASDLTIDIVTRGRRTGEPRVTEIWFMNLDGRIVICGTPGPRAWLANLKAEPAFEFRLKESIAATLTARATIVRDAGDRKAIMNRPETAWYREQGHSLQQLVSGSPIVEVRFTGDHAALNR